MTRVKGALRRFWRDEDGIGTLEIILIIAVIILLALVFRKWIMRLVQSLLTDADASAKEIMNNENYLKDDFIPSK
ncbi:multidrug transporter [Paenibacillus sp. IB182496]|uniref:Multidrug transporter n=1 Tax=Paenibacillus sabuli TaxID=2772509 RepID=A0A927BRB1_9BACL|nr:Flp1 family type IVb pilin [Paenibacillus sabuli]MBD2844325.1 multidrug transporter [Paenibacillus sabuli]